MSLGFGGNIISPYGVKDIKKTLDTYSGDNVNKRVRNSVGLGAFTFTVI